MGNLPLKLLVGGTNLAKQYVLFLLHSVTLWDLITEDTILSDTGLGAIDLELTW